MLFHYYYCYFVFVLLIIIFRWESYRLGFFLVKEKNYLSNRKRKFKWIILNGNILIVKYKWFTNFYFLFLWIYFSFFMINPFLCLFLFLFFICLFFSCVICDNKKIGTPNILSVFRVYMCTLFIISIHVFCLFSIISPPFTTFFVLWSSLFFAVIPLFLISFSLLLPFTPLPLFTPLFSLSVLNQKISNFMSQKDLWVKYQQTPHIITISLLLLPSYHHFISNQTQNNNTPMRSTYFCVLTMPYFFCTFSFLIPHLSPDHCIRRCCH